MRRCPSASICLAFHTAGTIASGSILTTGTGNGMMACEICGTACSVDDTSMGESAGSGSVTWLFTGVVGTGTGTGSRLLPGVALLSSDWFQAGKTLCNKKWIKFASSRP
jgi:hypothetical protein